MKLEFNLNGSAEPFLSYLKSYLLVRDSLLLEIDTNLRSFVAKTFTQDHGSIRFASLTFEDANMTITSDTDEVERKGERIKVGILVKLKKLIQIIERFADNADSKGVSNFNFTIEYGPMDLKDKSTGNMVTNFVATELIFSSDRLSMKMDGFRISEFDYISDQIFSERIFNVIEPVSIDLDGEIIRYILKTSLINTLDARKDVLVFYADGKTLYVKDQIDEKGTQPNFRYKIGELDVDPSYKISVPINRQRFHQMMDKVDGKYRLIIGQVQNEELGLIIDRILFDSIDSSIKIVVSAMRDS